MEIFRRIWNWLKRFRHRCGYGIHSPSDFHMVTFVIYESLPYYAFDALKKKKYAPSLPHYRRKVNELLFRLVNHLQPHAVFEVAGGNGASMDYMHEAHPSASFTSIAHGGKEEQLLWLRSKMEEHNGFDFLHVAFTPYYKEVVAEALHEAGDESCIVIGNIYESEEKYEWWKMLTNDERVRITYDLYDVGFVFFDSKRYKQNYIINFF